MITIQKHTLFVCGTIKLLQVLQEGTFSRLGGEESLHTDVLIIAASNSDLKVMAKHSIRKEEFRKETE
jgi:transcriptional regulator with GAF, ATPase, and Fis domain